MKAPLSALLFAFATSTLCLAEDSTWPGFGGPGSDFTASSHSIAGDRIDPGLRWKRSLGNGLSTLAVADDFVYVTYLKSRSDEEGGDRRREEAIAALDRESGQTRWEFAYEAGWLKSQEAFGGRSRSPQSTPLLAEDRVIAIGFTGWVHCLDRRSGELIWKMNLPARFDAKPVQFGFSSSPILVDGKLILLAGGQRGGLVALDLTDGSLLWNVPCDEASYATPVAIEFSGQTQIVFVTRNRVVGADADNGAKLWDYSLPKSGLTNVPTPLPIGDGRLIISGQGVGGTRELSVRRNGNQWAVEEGWFSRTQFFYCNWISSDGLLIGCDGDLLVAIDVVSGSTVGRWRGFSNSNLVRSDERFLILGGDGDLTLLKSDGDVLRVMARHQVFDGRCWVPPSLVGDQLFCRQGKDVACVQIDGGGQFAELMPERIQKPELRMRREGQPPADQMPTDRIVDAFETGGPDAAWKLYVQLRKSDGRLNLEARRELATLAFSQGLVDFAKEILQHAVQDFPRGEAAKRMQRELLTKHMPRISTEPFKGENGLLYVEFAIRNETSETVQTYVQGPAAHPFSYGIPFPPGKVRVEKWPVGTRLIQTHDDVRGRVLLSVDRKYAGKTIELEPAAGADAATKP